MLVLISRLPEELVLDNLKFSSNSGRDHWKHNNCLALITGCCRSNLISKEMRELFIKELIGLNIKLDDPELFAKFLSLCLLIGSKSILDFIPDELFSQMLKSGCEKDDLKRIDFVVSIEKLEEFLQGKGIFYGNEVMFEYIQSSRVLANWPIYIDWATYKISTKAINIDDKKAVALI